MDGRVLGIGNALIDVFSDVDDDFLIKNNLNKGSKSHVSPERVSAILSQLPDREQFPGGGSFNTVLSLSELSLKTSFSGKVGRDENGLEYAHFLKQKGISDYLCHGDKETGICCTLLTADNAKTVLTYPGSAFDFKKEELMEETFKENVLVYLEAFLLWNTGLLDRAMELAQKNECIVCLDAAGPEIIKRHREKFIDLAGNHTGILFANENEVSALTGLPAKESVDFLKSLCDLVVLKMGRKGAVVIQKNLEMKIPPYPADVVDTTGAGDLFSAGFLFGFINNLPLEKCGRLGSLMGSLGVANRGGRLLPGQYDEVKTVISRMMG